MGLTACTLVPPRVQRRSGQISHFLLALSAEERKQGVAPKKFVSFTKVRLPWLLWRAGWSPDSCAAAANSSGGQRVQHVGVEATPRSASRPLATSVSHGAVQRCPVAEGCPCLVADGVSVAVHSPSQSNNMPPYLCGWKPAKRDDKPRALAAARGVALHPRYTDAGHDWCLHRRGH